MFAIVKTGGKQYKFETNKVVEIEQLPEEVGQEVSFSEVLAVCKDGELILDKKFTVNGVVVKKYRAPKVIAFVKRRRTANVTKTKGHRQYMTAVLVKEIKLS